MSVPAWKSDPQSRRSALETTPLRLPGQSIDERITSLRDYVDDYLGCALCFFVVAGYQWIQWWLERPIHPIGLTLAAIGVIGYAAVKIRPLKSEIRDLRMGKEGERVVADMLDPLRKNGYRVFHDIPGLNFNIDHVLIADLLNDGRRGTLFTVRPVVVFPEWFIERRETGEKSDVWVLNPKALGAFLDHEPCVLSAELIDTAAHILTARDHQSYKATA